MKRTLAVTRVLTGIGILGIAALLFERHNLASSSALEHGQFGLVLAALSVVPMSSMSIFRRLGRRD